MSSAIASDLHYAIVSADPDQPRLERGRRYGKDCVRMFRACDVQCDAAAGDLLMRFYVSREIGADGRPMKTAIGGAPEHVAAEVRDSRILRRKCERRLPVEAIWQRRDLARVRVALIG